MLLSQYLYNRALIKKQLEKENKEIKEIIPKTNVSELSINLQEELIKEETQEFKKVIVKEKKEKKETIQEIIEDSTKEEDKGDNMEEKGKGEKGKEEKGKDHDFEIIENEQDKEIKEENNKIEEAEKSGGGDKDIKKVVVTFF